MGELALLQLHPLDADLDGLDDHVVAGGVERRPFPLADPAGLEVPPQDVVVVLVVQGDASEVIVFSDLCSRHDDWPIVSGTMIQVAASAQGQVVEADMVVTGDWKSALERGYSAVTSTQDTPPCELTSLQ